MHFDGVSGSIIVSFIAFSIVFAVLFGLTCMIYAMRLFAGGKSEKPKKDKPAGGAPAPAAPVAAVAAAPVQAAGGMNGKIVAAITAAIIEATNGMGRITAIVPELAADGSMAGPYYSGPMKRWKASGVVRLVNSSFDRGWRR